MYKAQIDTLAVMLNGADAEAIYRAEAMYVAKFRSENVTVFAALDCDDQRDLTIAAQEAIAAKMGLVKPVWTGDNEHEMDMWFDELEGIEVEIAPHTEVVYMCNYKGEGEGFALYEDVKNLPVFKSKRASAKFFGA